MEEQVVGISEEKDITIGADVSDMFCLLYRVVRGPEPGRRFQRIHGGSLLC